MRLYECASKESQAFVEKLCAAMFPIEQTTLVGLMILEDYIQAPPGATSETMWYIVRSASIADQLIGHNCLVIKSDLGNWWGINDRWGDFFVTPAKHNVTWLLFADLINADMNKRLNIAKEKK